MQGEEKVSEIFQKQQKNTKTLALATLFTATAINHFVINNTIPWTPSEYEQDTEFDLNHIQALDCNSRSTIIPKKQLCQNKISNGRTI